MPPSFFDLPSAPDSDWQSRHDLSLLAHQDYLDALSPAERATLEEQAWRLANVLYRAITTYCDTYRETTCGAILEALLTVQARIDREMEAEDADAPPAAGEA